MLHNSFNYIHNTVHHSVSPFSIVQLGCVEIHNKGEKWHLLFTGAHQNETNDNQTLEKKFCCCDIIY